MMSILFKTLALVLCLTFLFAVVLPQAQADWSWWACLAGKSSCLAGLAAAGATCAVDPPVCPVVMAAAIAWCVIVAENC